MPELHGKELVDLVQEVFYYCMWKEEEVKAFKSDEDAIKQSRVGEGVAVQVGFCGKRLEEKHEIVRDMLNEMPAVFHDVKGGGMSFAQLCTTKDNVQWGEHKNMDQLLCLGLATGMAQYCMPDRTKWNLLPAGLPYVFFNTEVREVEVKESNDE